MTDKVKIIPFTSYRGIRYIIARAVYKEVGIFKKRKQLRFFAVDEGDKVFGTAEAAAIYCETNELEVEPHFCK